MKCFQHFPNHSCIHLNRNTHSSELLGLIEVLLKLFISFLLLLLTLKAFLPSFVKATIQETFEAFRLREKKLATTCFC